MDGYNQLPLLTGQGPSNRKEIIYYERDTLQAVRYGDWKVHSKSGRRSRKVRRPVVTAMVE